MKKFLAICLCVLGLGACNNAESLNGNEFVLQSAGEQSPITLGFNETENKFFGKAVNNFFGNYSVDNGNIAFNQVGLTMMMGAPEDMQNEAEFLKKLAEVKSYTLNNGILTLVVDNENKLIFEQSKK